VIEDVDVRGRESCEIACYALRKRFCGLVNISRVRQRCSYLTYCTDSRTAYRGGKECSNLLFFGHGYARDVFDGNPHFAATMPRLPPPVSPRTLFTPASKIPSVESPSTMPHLGRSTMIGHYGRSLTLQTSGKNSPKPRKPEKILVSSKIDT
jgi:hypothetical protein